MTDSPPSDPIDEATNAVEEEGPRRPWPPWLSYLLAGIVAVVVGIVVVNWALTPSHSITITIPDISVPAAPISQPTVAPTAAPQYVCTAMHLGAAGNWSAAEEHWITNETKGGTDLQAVTAYLQLGEDAGAVALDQLEHKPTATDIATYNADLAGDSALTVGC